MIMPATWPKFFVEMNGAIESPSCQKSCPLQNCAVVGMREGGVRINSRSTFLSKSATPELTPSRVTRIHSKKHLRDFDTDFQPGREKETGDQRHCRVAEAQWRKD